MVGGDFFVSLCCCLFYAYFVKAYHCHPVLMQKLVEPFCVDNYAFPMSVIFKLNRKMFTAFSPPFSMLNDRNEYSIKDVDLCGIIRFFRILCACLLSFQSDRLSCCFGVEFLSLLLIFLLLFLCLPSLLLILPLVHANDSGFFHASILPSRKASRNLRAESFCLSHLYKNVPLES